MPFISKDRLRELERAEAEIEGLDKEDVKASRDFSRNIRKIERETREKYEDKEAELTGKHRAAVKKLNDELEDTKDKATADVKAAEAKSAEEIKTATDEANARVEVAERAQKAAEIKTAALEKLVKTEQELVKRELTVKAGEEKLALDQEILLDESQRLSDERREFRGAIADHVGEVAEARENGDEAGYKRGYANGLADGVRDIATETSKANDRNADIATKALEGMITTATKQTSDPVVNVLTVPAVVPQAAQKQSK